MRKGIIIPALIIIVCIAVSACSPNNGAAKKPAAPKAEPAKTAVEKRVLQALYHYQNANTIAGEIDEVKPSVTSDKNPDGTSISAQTWQEKILKLKQQRVELNAAIEGLGKAPSANKDPIYAEYCRLIEAVIKKDLKDNTILTQAAQLWMEISNDVAAAGTFNDVYYEKSKQAYAVEAGLKVVPNKYTEVRSYADKNKLVGADILAKLN